MKTDTFVQIQDEALEVVSGAGIGSAIGGAIDRVLGGAFNLLGKGRSAVGGLLSGLGGLLSGR